MPRLQSTLSLLSLTFGCLAPSPQGFDEHVVLGAYMFASPMQPSDLPPRGVEIRDDGSVVCVTLPWADEPERRLSNRLSIPEVSHLIGKSLMTRESLGVDNLQFEYFDSHDWRVFVRGSTPPSLDCRGTFTLDECGKDFSGLWRSIVSAAETCRGDERAA